jgi:hypothetical protein
MIIAAQLAVSARGTLYAMCLGMAGDQYCIHDDVFLRSQHRPVAADGGGGAQSGGGHQRKSNKHNDQTEATKSRRERKRVKTNVMMRREQATSRGGDRGQ